MDDGHLYVNLPVNLKLDFCDLHKAAPLSILRHYKMRHFLSFRQTIQNLPCNSKGVFSDVVVAELITTLINTNGFEQSRRPRKYITNLKTESLVEKTIKND